MVSVKSILDCVGVDTNQDLSMLGHMFGFVRGRVPTDPDPSVTAEVSILDWIRGVQDDHINLDIVQVGFDAMSSGARADGLHKIDYSVYRIRNIYRTVNLGVGRVEHYTLSSADADGMDDIGSENEAEDLVDDWNAGGNGIDVFMVRNISADFVGLAPAKGDGVVVAIERAAADDLDFERVARTFAHEVGHFLDLDHNHGDDPDCPDSAAGRRNLMAQTRCITNRNVAANVRAAVELTGGQGGTMDNHGAVQGGC
jgi:hypothetical protein